MLVEPFPQVDMTTARRPLESFWFLCAITILLLLPAIISEGAYVPVVVDLG
jgi:hypothetical protein